MVRYPGYKSNTTSKLGLTAICTALPSSSSCLRGASELLHHPSSIKPRQTRKLPRFRVPYSSPHVNRRAPKQAFSQASFRPRTGPKAGSFRASKPPRASLTSIAELLSATRHHPRQTFSVYRRLRHISQARLHEQLGLIAKELQYKCSTVVLYRTHSARRCPTAYPIHLKLPHHHSSAIISDDCVVLLPGY